MYQLTSGRGEDSSASMAAADTRVYLTAVESKDIQRCSDDGRLYSTRDPSQFFGKNVHNYDVELLAASRTEESST